MQKEDADLQSQRLAKHIYDTEMLSKDTQLMHNKVLKELKIIKNSNEQAMEVIALN